MREILVYAAEKEAGLVEQIQKNSFLSFASLAEIAEPFDIADKVKGRLSTKGGQSLADAFKSKAENVGQNDLHYLKTVLVTTGWNKNDDVFDRSETWAARRSPEDKPFNYEHNCADIIGHITSNYVIDDDSNLVAEDTLTDKLPAKFHVITAAVLYKFWDKADLQERMDKIIPEIIRGDWFVSMECLFSGFDYALLKTDGSQKVVARNDETAFLTKHLRAYGGDGVYQEYKVGRLIRNILFCGKGLVRKPANPESVIFSVGKEKEKNIFYDFQQSVYSSLSELAIKKEIKNKMSVELETLQKQLAKLQEENASLQTALRDNDVKQIKAQLESTQTEKSKAEELLKQANEKLAAQAGEVVDLQKKLEESEKTCAEVAEELKKVYATQTKADRVKLVIDKLKSTETDAIKLVEKFDGQSAEVFDSALEAMAATVAKFTPAPLPPKETPAPLPPQSTSAPAPMSGKGSEVDTDPADKNADVAVLEGGKKSDDVAMASGAAGVEDVRKAIAKYFGCEESNDE